MCRHLAYVGPPMPLAHLALDAPHSLLDQCTAAREMLHGCENLDGWGFGWFDGGPTARRYRRGLAMPDDAEGRDRLSRVESDHFVVHVRQKSPGATTDDTGSAPFWDGGRCLFAHNGLVAGFNDGVRDELRARVSARRLAGIEGDADSEVLFALVLDRLDAGKPGPEALGVVAEVAEEFGGRYNVLLTDGAQLVATTWGNSLHLRADRGVTVASEPLDDEAGWERIDDRRLLVIDADGLRRENW